MKTPADQWSSASELYLCSWNPISLLSRGLSALGFPDLNYLGQDPCEIENCRNGTTELLDKDTGVLILGLLEVKPGSPGLAMEPWACCANLSVPHFSHL